MSRQPLPRSREATPSAGREAGSRLLLLVGAALCLATIALLWLGYRATREWERSEAQLADRRASEKLALLIAALDRDMKGAQLSVLVPINQEQLAGGGSAGLATLFARAFARFPYPESFFVWSSPGATRETTYVFNRSDRRPVWDTAVDTPARYPVITRRNRTGLEPFIDRIRRDASHRKRFAAYELEIANVPYQVVVHLLYDDISGAGRLFGLVGYTVNLSWVKERYFEDLVRQVSHIGGEDEDMAVTLTNSSGTIVTAIPAGAAAPSGVHAQQFPIRFYDRNLTQLLPEDRQAERWTAGVMPFRDSTEPGALSGQRMLALMSLAALASIVGAAVIARGLVVRSELVAMKSEFVSTVTHELKTPLSLMRLVADALVTGRYNSPEKIPEYGELLSAEVSRMTRLIDNLLSFARVNRVNNFYSPAALDLAEVLEEAAANFRMRLEQLQSTLTIEMAAESIAVLADRTALLLVIDNLLDNAIEYSAESPTRTIAVRAHQEDAVVTIEVEDHGSGIPEHELPHVLEKFYRGSRARGGGSGLGLAIVNQIVRDHGGHVDINSVVDRGTTVRVVWPAAPAAVPLRPQA